MEREKCGVVEEVVYIADGRLMEIAGKAKANNKHGSDKQTVVVVRMMFT